MRQGVKLAIITPAVLLIFSGCATKDWVRETLGQRDAQVDERFGKVETSVGETAGRVGQVEGRLGDEVTRLGQVDETARTAGQAAETARQRADAAYARADEVNARLTRLWNNRHTRNVVETAEVQFAFDRADLDDGAQTVLAAFVKEMKENPALSVDLEGYTDPRGALDYNYQLSQRRVEAVRRYLVGQGVELPRIQAIGRGPLDDRGVPDGKKRRVMLRLMVQPD